jgi:hypothetical protein
MKRIGRVVLLVVIFATAVLASPGCNVKVCCERTSLILGIVDLCWAKRVSWFPTSRDCGMPTGDHVYRVTTRCEDEYGRRCEAEEGSEELRRSCSLSVISLLLDRERVIVNDLVLEVVPATNAPTWPSHQRHYDSMGWDVVRIDDANGSLWVALEWELDKGCPQWRGHTEAMLPTLDLVEDQRRRELLTRAVEALR